LGTTFRRIGFSFTTATISGGSRASNGGNASDSRLLPSMAVIL
jgi:hypothetical protein